MSDSTQDRPTSTGVQITVGGDRDVRPALELMDAVNTSILPKALAISLAGHLVFLALTSFGLYRDWAEFGIKMPGTIKQLKQERRNAAAAEERRLKREELARQRDEARAAQSGNTETKGPGSSSGADAASRQAEAVEKLNEIDTDIPTSTSVDLDAELDLE